MNKRILDNIEPKQVMKFFEDISAIPRESKKEKQVSDWLVTFAKERGLEVIQDKSYNVIIKKPATSGYEQAPIVIIQGHMDMVCEQNQGTNHDFANDGIKLQVNGDFISGTGTTLGADNGIAVAFALALLDSKDIPHPALEVLLTADEEQGMSGAMNLDGSHLKGRLMINLDAGENLFVSCAGGARGEIEIATAFDTLTTTEQGITIEVRGLQGGHSGGEIHEQRGNSNKLLGRALNEIRKELPFNIAEIFGGAKENAIPREAEATLKFKNYDATKLNTIITQLNKTFKDEYKTSDPHVEIKLNTKPINKVMNDVTTKKIVDTIILHPNGINTWSKEIENLVESSLNLGVIEMKDNSVCLRSAIRGSVLTRKIEIIEELRVLADVVGAKFVDSSHYPAWEYKKESKLRDIFAKVYENVLKRKPKVVAVHAGLECGLLSEKLPGVDIIAFGPGAYGAHTPEEKLSIKSTQEIWNYLLEGLKALKDYK